jgi:hypothetical protein
MAMLMAVLPVVLSRHAVAQSSPSAIAASDVYIEQSRGRVGPTPKAPSKPTPETTGAAIPSTGPTAPITCNAQNASSQACYTATQQARPATR